MRNLNKHIILILLFCIGAFVIPNYGFAKENNVTMMNDKCCVEMAHHKKIKGEDCTKENSCPKEHNGQNHCNTKGKICHNVNFTFLALPVVFNVKPNINFLELQKQILGFQESYNFLKDSAIWQPPQMI